MVLAAAVFPSPFGVLPHCFRGTAAVVVPRVKNANYLRCHLSAAPRVTAPLEFVKRVDIDRSAPFSGIVSLFEGSFHFFKTEISPIIVRVDPGLSVELTDLCVRVEGDGPPPDPELFVSERSTWQRVRLSAPEKVTRSVYHFLIDSRPRAVWWRFGSNFSEVEFFGGLYEATMPQPNDFEIVQRFNSLKEQFWEVERELGRERALNLSVEFDDISYNLFQLGREMCSEMERLGSQSGIDMWRSAVDEWHSFQAMLPYQHDAVDMSLDDMIAQLRSIVPE